MPTPTFTIRLPKETQQKLAVISQVYGAPNLRAFVRELLEVAAEGDVGKAQAFIARLLERIGGQMAFNLSLPVVEGPKGARKPALKAKAKGGRHGGDTG